MERKGKQRSSETVADPLMRSREQAACPLCGKDLALASEPERPAITIERLGRHFANDCTATLRPTG